MSQTIGDVGEFGLIKIISDIIGTASDKTHVGIGDDAATLKPIEKPIIVTTDAMIEGVHFRCDWSTPEEIAHKALASNLSDLAAKAAMPMHYVITFGVPFDLEVEWAVRFYTCLAEQSKAWDIELVGGDTVKAPQIIISITAWGVQTSQEPISVSGAKVGDWILVTGSLGDSAAGLELLGKKIKKSPANQFLLERFHTPQPRHLEAIEIIQNVIPSSMTDISDGLARDLEKLCQASGVGALVESDLLPVSEALNQYAKANAKKYALRGGEDYELLLTLQGDLANDLIADWTLRCPIIKIGKIMPSANQIIYSGIDEPIRGFDHFSQKTNTD